MKTFLSGLAMAAFIFAGAFIMFCFGGCSKSQEIESYEKHQCVNKEDRAALAKFIIECSKAANPLSDEEGEDLVAQCERTGERTLCETTKMCRVTYLGYTGMPYKYGDYYPCK